MLSDYDFEVLQKARDLIADSENWITNQRAGDEFGISVSEHSPWATKWCAVGALNCAAGRLATGFLIGDLGYFHLVEVRIREVLDAKARDLYPDGGFWGSPAVYVNNFMGHEATLAMFDKVLADERID